MQALVPQREDWTLKKWVELHHRLHWSGLGWASEGIRGGGGLTASRLISICCHCVFSGEAQRGDRYDEAERPGQLMHTPH